MQRVAGTSCRNATKQDLKTFRSLFSSFTRVRFLPKNKLFNTPYSLFCQNTFGINQQKANIILL